MEFRSERGTAFLGLCSRGLPALTGQPFRACRHDSREQLLDARGRLRPGARRPRIDKDGDLVVPGRRRTGRPGRILLEAELPPVRPAASSSTITAMALPLWPPKRSSVPPWSTAVARGIVADRTVVDRMASTGATARASTPEEHSSLIAADLAKWTAVIRAAGLRANP
jgi:hypothetical protein